jgi:hypothetical protein
MAFYGLALCLALRGEYEGAEQCVKQAIALEPIESTTVSSAMVVVLTYWLSYEYVRDPRNALEPAGAAAALSRGAYHVLSLLAPYLGSAEQAHLQTLAGAYKGNH